jgi:AraC-like DNA-binding protein
MFYSGRLCGLSGGHEDQVGHLHVLRRGTLEIIRPDGQRTQVGEPSVIFYPRPFPHRFQVADEAGAEVVCASVEFGAGMLNPLVRALPEVLIVPLQLLSELAPTVELMFAEAFGQQPGRQTAVDRLTEYFLVLLLRAAMKQHLVQGGVLMGLADARLARAIAAVHQAPEHTWTLEQMAAAAGMSRARFAVRFRAITGLTPFEYLADWRVGVAQGLLKKGEALKIVAPAVGYSSSAALTRLFRERIGQSPGEWLAASRPA